MQRVAIIGNGGAGKTTLARELGRRVGLPVVYLDRVFWRPGWVEPDPCAWQRAHRDALAGAVWIADGNFGSTMAERLRHADTIVLVDPPPLLCVWGAAWRKLRWLGRSRDDLPAGCFERLAPQETLAFWRYIWGYRRKQLPAVLELLDGVRPEKRVEILRSRRDIRRFLDGVRRDDPERTT